MRKHLTASWQGSRNRSCSQSAARADRAGRRSCDDRHHGAEETMKRLLVLMLVSWCGAAAAQTAQELIDNGKNTENVTTFGMGYNLNQYSPLAQINKQTVKRLVPVWSTSLANDTGELAQPTIYNGVMYVVNG